MKLKANWNKNLAMAQVSLILKTYGLLVEKANLTKLGDFTAYWSRNKKTYLFWILPDVDKEAFQSSDFKETLKFCLDNKLKLVVISFGDLSPEILEISSRTQIISIIAYNKMKELERSLINC